MSRYNISRYIEVAIEISLVVSMSIGTKIQFKLAFSVAKLSRHRFFCPNGALVQESTPSPGQESPHSFRKGATVAVYPPSTPHAQLCPDARGATATSYAPEPLFLDPRRRA